MKPGVIGLLILGLIGLAAGLFISGMPTYITLFTVGGILTAYLTFNYPVVIIAILLMIAPFNILWVGVGITPYELVYGLCYLLLVVSWVIKRVFWTVSQGMDGQVRTAAISSPIAIPLFSFFVITIIACIIGILRGREFAHWGSDLNAISYYGLCFLMLDLVKEKRNMYRLFVLMLISMIFGIIYGIYTGLFESSPGLRIGAHIYPRLHPASETGLTLLIILTALAIGLKGGIKKLSFAGLIILFSIMQLLSFVRSRWIAIICGISCLFFAFLPNRKRAFTKLIVVLVVLLSLYLLLALSFPQENVLFRWGSGIASRYNSIFIAWNEPSLSSRRSEWNVAWEKALRRPFFGNGLGTQITFFRDDKWFGTPTWHTTRYIHNAPLFVFLNMGLIGLITFLWFFSSVVSYGFRLYKTLNNNFDRLFAVGISCALITLMVASLAGLLFTSPVMTMWVGFFAGSLIILDRSREQA